MAARLRWLTPILLVTAVLLCFSPALRAGFVNWDDKGLLVENAAYRGLDPSRLRWMFTTFHMGHYHPLTWMTFAIDHRLWGMDARGYHLTNVILHAANTVLVWVLARRLTAAAGGGAGSAGAALAALLFGIHPLRVESVAWVTERRDVLSIFFLLLTVLAWLRVQTTERRRAAWYAVALGCFALSLLSKAWGVTLPAVLLVMDLWPLRRLGRGSPRHTPLARLVVEKLPFLALAAAAGTAAVVAQRSAGAMSEAAHLTVLQRMMLACYGLVFYLRKSVIPTGLSPAYLLEHDPVLAEPRYVISAAALVLGAALLAGVRRRSPATFAAFLSYAVLVSPVLGLAQSGVQIAADRYSYVSCVPLALLAGAGLAALVQRAGRASVVVPIALLAALGVATRRQTAIWHDSLTLWNHALAVDPANWLAHNSRGTAYEEVGDTASARADFDAAIRAAPGYAMAYNNRGHVRVRQGDVAGAIEDWNRALALAPRFADALQNRGAARLMQGDTSGAVADLEAAARLAPGSASAWYDLATAHVMLGRLDLAVDDCRRALDTAPPDGDLRGRAERKLGALLRERGLSRQ